MSIFKDSWIILKKNKNNKEEIYTIFSLKFGKILAMKKYSKKEKNLDLGFLIDYEIKVSEKNDISKIQNIKIINEFYTLNKNFTTIHNYLYMLNIVNNKLAFWIEHQELFEILNSINKYKKQDINIKIILASLKIINLLWELQIENKDTNIKKILYFINKNKFSQIQKLTGISPELEKKLEKLIYF